MSNEWTARLLREFLVTQVLRRVATRARPRPGRGAAARRAWSPRQMAGLAMMRYIIRLEPLASRRPETLVAAVGPTVQRYLTGDVAAGPVPAA